MPEMTGFRSASYVKGACTRRIINQARNQSHPTIARATADIKITFVGASRMSAKQRLRWRLVPKYLPSFPDFLQAKNNG